MTSRSERSVVRAVRHRRGWRLEDVSRRAGLSRALASDTEHGTFDEPHCAPRDGCSPRSTSGWSSNLGGAAQSAIACSTPTTPR
ncbi:MAG TPA: helix-turn-helix transcriptional regulator [Candidatus Limnocylindria bacterium]|nr:helix-turn-helix transcriptional regulator [Candidatus Limnocylindria bacterium]